MNEHEDPRWSFGLTTSRAPLSELSTPPKRGYGEKDLIFTSKYQHRHTIPKKTLKKSKQSMGTLSRWVVVVCCTLKASRPLEAKRTNNVTLNFLQITFLYCCLHTACTRIIHARSGETIYVHDFPLINVTIYTYMDQMNKTKLTT
jgi:hypothetical protein